MIKTAVLYHCPLTFAAREPLLLFSPQNSLDHDNGYRRPKNRPFGDLKLHGYSYGFFP